LGFDKEVAEQIGPCEVASLKVEPIVIAFLMPLIVLLTVVASVGLGVLSAYFAIMGILLTFGRAPQAEPAMPRPRLVLVPTQTHASGD
jgi:hypothetical protein